MGTNITLVSSGTYSYSQAADGVAPHSVVGSAVDLGDASTLRVALAITATSKHPTDPATIPQNQGHFEAGQLVGLNPGFFCDVQHSPDGTTWTKLATLIDDHDTTIGTRNIVLGPTFRYVRAVFRLGAIDNLGDAYVTFSLTGAAS